MPSSGYHNPTACIVSSASRISRTSRLGSSRRYFLHEPADVLPAISARRVYRSGAGRTWSSCGARASGLVSVTV